MMETKIRKRILGNSNLEVTAVELTPGELQEMNMGSSKITVQGDRYSGGSAKLINR